MVEHDAELVAEQFFERLKGRKGCEILAQIFPRFYHRSPRDLSADLPSRSTLDGDRDQHTRCGPISCKVN
jgi:hypothetical protein